MNRREAIKTIAAATVGATFPAAAVTEQPPTCITIQYVDEVGKWCRVRKQRPVGQAIAACVSGPGALDMAEAERCLLRSLNQRMNTAYKSLDELPWWEDQR